jgi:lipopolysaccharide transport system ATP-binding protein
MADDIVIKADQLSKAYRIWTDPSQRLISPLLAEAGRWLPGSVGRALNQKAAAGYRDFFALQDVSFEVKRGEAVGIIGRNGSGKSTLLQIIARTMQATKGSVKVKGRVAALLELGSGFNPEFTGRENVYLNGAVLGLTRREVDARFDDIAAFADIGDFMDQSVKTYSSGMTMRLAFAVQSAVEPDILIVDEALSVGDFFFQQKCAARMRALRERGTTVLLVAHDMASVRDLCQRVLYLRQGKMMFWGESQEAIALYYGESSDMLIQPTPPATPSIGQLSEAAIQSFKPIAHWWHDRQPVGISSNSVELLGIIFLDELGRPTTQVPMGRELIFRIFYRALMPGHYHVALELKNRYDQVLSSCGSYTCGLEALPLTAGQIACFDMAMQLNIEAGRYTCQVVLGQIGNQPNRGQRLAVSPWLGPIEITWPYDTERAPFLGMFGPPTRGRFAAKLPTDLP